VSRIRTHHELAALSIALGLAMALESPEGYDAPVWRVPLQVGAALGASTPIRPWGHGLIILGLLMLVRLGIGVRLAALAGSLGIWFTLGLAALLGGIRADASLVIGFLALYVVWRHYAGMANIGIEYHASGSRRKREVDTRPNRH
jgi:hypothetical protein